MAIAEVTAARITAHGTAFTSGTVDTTGCNLLVVNAAWFNPSAPVTLTDSKGNTWVPLTAALANNSNSQLFYTINPTVGSGHTFTFSASFSSICVTGFSGVKTSSPFDVENGHGDASGATTEAPGSITPSENNELVVSGLDTGLGGQPYTIDSGFTISCQDDGGGVNFPGALAFIIQTSAGAVNPTWTLTGSTQAAATIASFKAAAVASGFFGRPYYEVRESE